MVSENLSRILKQVPKLELMTILSKWGKIPTWKINDNRQKHDIIKQVCHIAQGAKITVEDVYRLDLLVTMNKKARKLWKAYEMKNSDGTTKLSDTDFEASTFEKRLQQQIAVTLACSVVVLEHNHAIWGRLSSPSSSRPIYFIHFPLSSFVLVAKPSSRLFATLTKELKQVLGYNEIHPLNLESLHPESLAQILLHNRNKNNNYTYDKKYYCPKLRAADENLGDAYDERINVCHSMSRRRNRELVNQQFGKDAAPVLSKLEITTVTKFRGRRFIPNLPHDVTIHCQTTLKGPNVIEGLRTVAQQNLTSSRLPRFLTNVSNTGKQFLKITEQMSTGNRSSA
uniref:Centromere protein N-like n=1 Tax=Phallusia mammillata TaxID=59560 RepID=A0A6F9D8F0_9ASCI|nr:centromere protein N-like [Phallusia mammillata]